MDNYNAKQQLNNTRLLLEKIYQLYNGDTDGEMVMIDELDCFIYKGKKMHFDQNIIMYTSEEGMIKIDGTEANDNAIAKSFVKINGKDEVGFDMLTDQIEEIQFVENVIDKLNNKLNPNHKLH